MPGRRPIDTTAPIRSSLAHAALAVEERVVWGGADVLRGVADVVRWPFERAIWAIERGFVWPLEERSGEWSASVRALGLATLALLAAGAGVLGLLWASGSGGGGTAATTQASAPVAAPVVKQALQPAAAVPEPALQGAKPDFTDAPQAGAAKGSTAGSESSAATSGSDATAAAGSTAEVAKSASPGAAGAKVKPAGPEATKVAHRFAGAFVLYEIGRKTDRVEKTFRATATPRLAHELLSRPPRQPTGVKVPKAKVLNVVAGPQHGSTYTLSVSLLRVGVTSELRLDLERNPKSGEWEVTNSLG